MVQDLQVLESEMAGEEVKPEVSVEERVERCRERQGVLESRCRRALNYKKKEKSGQ